MNDSSRTKTELIAELAELRLQVQRAEALEAEHKAVAEALEESEAKYRSLFENATEGVYQTSADGKIVAANPALVKMLGYESEAELKKVDVAADLYVLSEERSHFTRELADAGLLREMELTLKRKDGQHIAVLDSARVMRHEDGRVLGFWGVLTDITERRRAEDKLRQTQFTVDHAANSVFWMGDDARLIYVNEAACRSLGYSREELLSMTVHDIDPDFPPDAWPDHWSDLKKHRALVFESRHRTKDGRVYPVEVSANYQEYSGVGFNCAFARDISARKHDEEERRRLELRVRDAQKMESLSVLAGGVAHDFNNLLMGVLGNAELALLELSPDSGAQDCVEKIRTAALRAADLARQMLAYSGKGSFVVGSIDLSAVVSEMGQLVQSSISANAVVEYHLSEDMRPVSADATQIRQLVMNLISNACEALGDRGGIVDVSTGMMECNDEYIRRTFFSDGCAPGCYVFLDVSDTGIGMNEATIDKMFDPFFTTKFTGRGLGLAAVSGIIRGHHGAILVDSTPGKGTSVRVLFPAASGQVVTPLEEADEIEHRTGDGEVVLLVDDDASVLDVGTRMLESGGFRVITATDGHGALHAFKEHSNEIDCVLLDLTMPGMGGEDTYEELRRIHCDVPVILGSGYFHAELREQFKEKGFAAVLQKPYRREFLLATVATAIGGES
jgi:two-component system cell cycle sensor histidine kinase/response regulator CckA